MSRQDDLKKLIAEHSRHLQILKEQEAEYGLLNVPTHIVTQIQDREAEIEKLRVELAELDSLEQVPHLNPYRGLSAFREEDAALFSQVTAGSRIRLSSMKISRLAAGPSHGEASH
jgi:hypothetical protein